MLFGNDRRSMRQTYADAWRKQRTGQPRTPLEDQIAAVIALHPEYHAMLEDEASLEREFTPAEGAMNPFLHMSLHLAIRDQVATDRPAGILAVFDSLCRSTGNVHDAEHIMLERLGEALWRAQRNGSAPDEQQYLRDLQTAVRQSG